MFKRVGEFTARYPWLVLAVWVLLGTTLARFAPSWEKTAQDDDINFLPARCASVKGYQLLQQAFPQEVYASRLIFAFERRDSPLYADDFQLVDGVVAELLKLRDAEPQLQIKKIVSQRDPFMGSRLLSDDKQCTLVQVSLGTPYLAVRTRDTVNRADRVVRDYLAHQGDHLPDVYTTGPAGVGRDLISAGGNSLDGTTLATVLLVIVILLFVYRSPYMALIPLVSIALAVWVALNILALCTLIPGFYLVNISQIFAVVMLYGAGTDYCLFLISRYREELAAGKRPVKALGDAVGGVGGALAASAGTVICGLGLMGLAEFAKVRCGGPAIAVSLAVALLASLTLTPALLSLLGRIAFWPMGTPRMAATDEEAEGMWGWISRQVIAHPILIGCVSFLAMVPLAILGLMVKPTYRATAELSNNSSSVSGLAAISRHFTPGELGPITLLLESDSDWDTPQGRRVIEHLSFGFRTLTNVAEVRSLTQPLGRTLEPSPESKPDKLGFLGALVGQVTAKLEDRVQSATKSVYLSTIPALNTVGSVSHDTRPFANAVTDVSASPSSKLSSERLKYVTRLDVVLKSDPFDARSSETLEVLQTWIQDALPTLAKGMGEVRGQTYGITVSSRDLATVTESDRLRINLMVLAGIFMILLYLVRQVGLSIYLLVTVLLSYYATLGATTILAHYWHGRPIGEVDWRVPFFLFTILVAVGEDYNIFLISRALEEKDRHGGEEGLRRALAHTGGTITSCGLIMAGTFATLMLAGLNTLVQVGFALAFGVLLDTFVVRPFLVPAFTVWLWRETTTAEDVEEESEWSSPLEYRRAG